MTDPPLRVAILGSSIVSVALLRGLLRYPHVAVELFEARPGLLEDLPATQLSRGVTETLAALDPTLEGCLDRAGAVLSFNEVLVATGAHAGRTILPRELGGPMRLTVRRQALLSQLLAGVPHEAIHVNARVSSIQAPASLVFADGTTRHFDVIVGSDGVHGVARDHVLSGTQYNDLNSTTRPTSWFTHTTVPIARAREAMGTEFLDPNNRYRTSWIGYGGFLMANVVNHGQDVQLIVACALDRDDLGGSSPWARVLTPEEFEQRFSAFEGRACRGFVNVCSPSPLWMRTLAVAGPGSAR